jgi:hypothetical protein
LRSIIAGSSALVSVIGPTKFSATTLFQNSGVPSTKGAVRPQPAALTSTSTAPCSRLHRLGEGGDRRRVGQVDRLKLALLAGGADGRGGGLAAVGVDVGDDHLAPGAASASAVARPMPEPAPVTMAVLVVRVHGKVSFSGVGWRSMAGNAVSTGTARKSDTWRRVSGCS